MFDKGNLGRLFQEVQKLQARMKEVQEKLDATVVEGQAGGGMVRVKANGKMEILSVSIEPEVLQEDREMVEDLVLAAVNNAIEKAREAAKEEMASMTGGLMPGGFPIPGM